MTMECKWKLRIRSRTPRTWLKSTQSFLDDRLLDKMLRGGYFIQMMQLRGTSIWLSQCKYYYYIYLNSFIVITCFIAPYSFAFPENFSSNMQYLDYVMSAVFALDILFNFFTAYQDDNYNIIDDHKVTSGHLIYIMVYLVYKHSLHAAMVFHRPHIRYSVRHIHGSGESELIGKIFTHREGVQNY